MSAVEELTPHGRGGVSVLVLHGESALERLRRLTPAVPELGAAPKLCRLVAAAPHEAGEADEDLDEALVWRRPDGALELHLHGSPVLVARVRELLEEPAGSEDAPRRPDLLGGLLEAQGQLEARAAARLPSAASAWAARLLLDQAAGALRIALEAWLELTSEQRACLAAELCARGQAARWLVEVPRVVIAGPVNAGKSTLFNLLVGQQRVVVSRVAGTTRDVIDARVRLGAFALELVDTAGERRATGAAASVEREGQVQALAQLGQADLVLWLARGERPPLALLERATPLVELFGRADELGEQAPAGALPIAPREAPGAALEVVEQAFVEALGLPPEALPAGCAVPFDGATRKLARLLVEAPEMASTRQAVLAALS